MNEQASNRFCMCITPQELSEAAREALGIGNRKAAMLNDFQWPTASTISIKFMDGDSDLQQRVRAAAEGWLYDEQRNRSLANLTFDFVPKGDADIRIAFVQGDGSWSYLGTVCRQIPQDEPTMNYGWLTPESSDEDIRSVVLHEFGHALGLIHEHQNPRQGIQWDEDAVIADLSGPPNNWTISQIRRNVLDRYDPNLVSATPVDNESIMMYPIPARWTNGTFTAGFNTDLTLTDKAFIAFQYP
jgi:serralysin